LHLGDGQATFVQVTDGTGSFLINKEGVAASFTVVADFSSLPGVTLSSGALTVQVNTTAAAVNQVVDVNGTPVTFAVPGGPFVRVEAVGATLRIGGSGTGAGTQLTGDFAFDQSSASGSTVTRVAVANLQATVGDQSIVQGEGAFVIKAGGIAGFISGKAAPSAAGFSAGAAIGLRLNN